MQIDPMPSSFSPGLTRAQKVSDGLEMAFLSEMLKYAGPRPLEGEFGGGAGEEQFASLLTETYAGAVAGRIDLGLTGKIGGKP